MTDPALEALRDRLDAATEPEAALLRATAAALAPVFGIPAPAEAEIGAGPVQAALGLVERCLPGWSIHLTGQACRPNGHWSCALRASDTSDNDELIGTARSPDPALALLCALVRVAILKSR